MRAWVASGKLRAEPAGVRTKRRGVGPSRWLIDTDELAALPGVRLDGALLAELQSRAALVGDGENILDRLERIERSIAELQQGMRELQGKEASRNDPIE